MICKAVYDNETDVPAQHKDDFMRRADGKWVMKDDAIPGAAELLNPGLAANRDRALTQKTAAEEARRTAEQRATELDAQLAAAREPGGVILTKADAAVWQRFQKLGDVKTVEGIVATEYPKLKAAAQLTERQKAWGAAAQALAPFGVNLNLEALSDMMTHPQRGEGLEIELRPVEVDNGQGGKVTVNFPFITKRVPVAGKENEFTVEATALLDYAGANWPAWAVQALTSGAESAASGGGGAAFGGNPSGGTTGAGLIPLQTGGGVPAFTGQPPAAFSGQQPAQPSSFTFPQQPGAFRLPSFAQPGGVRLPAMGAGSSTGGGGGSQVLDGAAQAKQFNERRNAGKTSPFARGGSQQQQTGGGSQQQQTGGAQQK